MADNIVQNIITLKISYFSNQKDLIKEYQKDYSKLLRCTYNYIKKSPIRQSTAKISFYQKSLSNIKLDSWFMASSLSEAKAMIKVDKELNISSRVFGGKKNNILRSQNKISKEEYLDKRLSPICSIGEALLNCNRKFQIINYDCIIFKPNKKDHIFLDLKGLSKNYKKYFNLLIKHQEQKDLPITYKLDQEFIYISFDLNKLEINESEYFYKKDRIFAIDMNPNYIGYSIVDWKSSSEFKVVSSGVISLKGLNDKEKSFHIFSDGPKKKYFANKRKYEIICICKDLVKLAKHFQCEIFVMEDLNMESKDHKNGRSFNRLVNSQWCRDLFVHQIRKRLSLSMIQLEEIAAAYSSFIGNLAYRSLRLPDMCLSSIEIGRRAYEFHHQYVLKDKQTKKNIIFNNDPQVINNIVLSLEELNFIDTWESLKDLYDKIKESKLKYRFQLTDCNAVFSKYNRKSCKNIWLFI